MTVLDLLAAVPSLIYGIWGFFFLSRTCSACAGWLADNLGMVPFFTTPRRANLAASPFIAGIVVSLMVLPIITAVMREVFSQTPPGEKEAALRWAARAGA